MPVLTQELEKDLCQARQELTTLKLVSKVPRDHLDKADTYRELGHLECDLRNYQDAEKSYVNAVDTYDDALQLAPEDPDAKTNRAGVLENLSSVRVHLRQKGLG
jgi:regulator of sirC expression with transglutaminase-like and TPR domain